MRGDREDPTLERAAAIVAASRTARAVQRAIDAWEQAARTSRSLTGVKRGWQELNYPDFLVLATVAIAVHVAGAAMLPALLKPTTALTAVMLAAAVISATRR